MDLNYKTFHRSVLSTLSSDRLLYGLRDCPSRTLYGIFNISLIYCFVKSFRPLVLSRFSLSPVFSVGNSPTAASDARNSLRKT